MITGIPTEKIEKGKQMNIVIMLAMAIFTIGTFTIDSFLYSYQVERLYLISTTVLFIFAYMQTKSGINIYRIDLMWFMFFTYFMLNMAYQGKFKMLYVMDILAFAFVFIFLLLAKIEAKYIKKSLTIMYLISIIYAFSSLFQYWFMDIYSRFILPMFSSSQIDEILRIYARGSYSGFTWQTAFISGYIVFGLGIVFFTYKNVKNKVLRLIMLASIPLLFLSLFMAGERSHLVFMFVALIITLLFSTELKKFFGQFIRITFGIILGLIILILIMTTVSFDEDSQIGKVVNRLTGTIEGFIAGEDVTSGRVILYDFAFELFNENPIFGVGWRTYSESSIGVLNADRASHPHNIYIQLLTELGIIGFLLFLIPVCYTFVKTIKLLLGYSKFFGGNLQWKMLIQFSLYIQTFFLIYGLTGNLLTDRLYLFMYVFAVSITFSAIKYSIKPKRKLKKDEVF